MPDKLEVESLLSEKKAAKIRSSIPSAVTAVRLGFVPLLVFLVSSGMLFFGAILFLFLLCSDFLDGYLARRYGVSSKFGTYFDVATDFVFVFSMFMVFIPKGFCPDWILVLIAVVFVQFVLTSLYFNRIYDPVGKYYGSLLYGAIGLRFILSGQVYYDVVTVGVVAFAFGSILSRVVYFVKTYRA